MQNDYLNNKKDFFVKDSIEKKPISPKKLSPKSKVDINKLLNRVKIEKKMKKKQNLIISALVGSVIGIIGIISVL